MVPIRDTVRPMLFGRMKARRFAIGKSCRNTQVYNWPSPGHERDGAVKCLDILAHRMQSWYVRAQHHVDQDRQKVIRSARGIKAWLPRRTLVPFYPRLEATTLVKGGEEDVAATHHAQYDVSRTSPSPHLTQFPLAQMKSRQIGRYPGRIATTSIDRCRETSPSHGVQNFF